jgi:hypothetical protein
MRDLAILAIHLLVTFAKLFRPGGVRAVAAESLLLKHQLLISNRARQRAPNLTAMDRFVLGLTTLVVSPSRIPKLAALIKPATLFKFHTALVNRRRVARGVSPPRSRRTGREARASYGSHHGTTPGHQLPMGKQRGIAPRDPGYPAACSAYVTP